jgi:septal ring factor EnvC (AmiA/AmiB activator)
MQSPLLESEIQSAINQVKETYSTLNKDLKSLENINSLSDTDFPYSQSEYYSLKTKITQSLQTLKQLLNQLSSTDTSNDKLQVTLLYMIIPYRKTLHFYLKKLIKQQSQINKMNLNPFQNALKTVYQHIHL